MHDAAVTDQANLPLKKMTVSYAASKQLSHEPCEYHQSDDI
jgi:hypothetical protein